MISGINDTQKNLCTDYRFIAGQTKWLFVNDQGLQFLIIARACSIYTLEERAMQCWKHPFLLLTEVRQYCAWMVLGWETGKELQLLLTKSKAGLRCGTMWARQMCAKLFQGVLALESLDSAPDRLLRVVGSDPLFPQTLLFQAIPSQKPKLVCSHMLDLKDQQVTCSVHWAIKCGGIFRLGLQLPILYYFPLQMQTT